MVPFPFINGTLEKMLTGMRTHTVTNGTIFFFLRERNALWVIFHQGRNYNHREKHRVWVCDEIPIARGSRGWERRLNASLPCSWLEDCPGLCVCRERRPRFLSAVPGAGAASFLPRVEAVKVLKVVRLSCSRAQLLQEQAG